jgi:hypothetical protein
MRQVTLNARETAGDGFAHTFAEPVSRRVMLARFGALGIAAATAQALMPLAGAANKGRHRGKRGNEGNRRSSRRNRGSDGQGNDGRPGGKKGHGGQDGVRTAASDAPTITGTGIWVYGVPGSPGVRKVVVKGTVNFSSYHRSEIRRGLKYRLRAQVWEADSGGRPGHWYEDNDDHCFSYPTVGVFLQPGASSFTKSFSANVGTGTLNHDRFSADELYGLLILESSRDGRNWQRAREVETAEKSVCIGYCAGGTVGNQ